MSRVKLAGVDVCVIVGRLMRFGVPMDYANAVGDLLNSATAANSEAKYLREQVEFLMRFAPPEVREPGKPVVPHDCRSKWE